MKSHTPEATMSLHRSAGGFRENRVTKVEREGVDGHLRWLDGN